MSISIAEIRSNLPQLQLTATVVYKSDINVFGSHGKYINLELFDGESIKLTLFNEDVEKVKNVREQNVYQFLNLRSKVTKANFANVNKHDVELFGNKGMEILLEESMWFDTNKMFIPLNEVQNCKPNLIVCVKATMKEKKDTKASRLDGSEFTKREIILYDHETTAELQILGTDDIEKVPFEKDLMVKFKRLKIFGTPNKKFLQFMKDSSLETDMDTSNTDDFGDHLKGTLSTDDIKEAIENIGTQPIMVHSKDDVMEAVKQLMEIQGEVKIEITKTLAENEQLFIINKIENIEDADVIVIANTVTNEATPKKTTPLKAPKRKPSPSSSQSKRLRGKK